VRPKFELTDLDSVGRKSCTVLTSNTRYKESHLSQVSFFTGDNVK